MSDEPNWIHVELCPEDQKKLETLATREYRTIEQQVAFIISRFLAHFDENAKLLDPLMQGGRY